MLVFEELYKKKRENENENDSTSHGSHVRHLSKAYRVATKRVREMTILSPQRFFQPQAKTADTQIFMGRTITFISNQAPHSV